MTLAALPRLYRAHYGDMTGSTSERDRYSHVVALIRRFREYRGLQRRHAAAGIPRCRWARRRLHPSDEEES